MRLHDARHTFATLMLERWEHPKTVQAMLGHGSVAITLDIYSHVSLELETRV
jgi:integrase